MTPKTLDALQRLVQNADFKTFLAHLEESRNTAIGQFISAPVTDIQVHQGRVQTFDHVIKEIRHVEK